MTHAAEPSAQFAATLSLAGAAGLHRGPPPRLADEGRRRRRRSALLKEVGHMRRAALRRRTSCCAPTASPTSATSTSRLATATPGWSPTAKLDFSQSYAPEALRQIDAGKPLVALAGVHPGCHELFAREPINSIKDLKGKRVAIPTRLGYATSSSCSVVAASVGLDPATDINWVDRRPTVDPIQAVRRRRGRRVLRPARSTPRSCASAASAASS